MQLPEPCVAFVRCRVGRNHVGPRVFSRANQLPADRSGATLSGVDVTRHRDGSAGDADYGDIGFDYSVYRQPEPAIAAAIVAALADSRTVINLGAGAGSYEPRDRLVTAVEPSETMRCQRPAELPPAVDARAEDLPFPDNAFDAALATFTVHQWRDLAGGLAEARRVTTGPIVVLTCDPDELTKFWLNDYAPEVLATEARRYPPIQRLIAILGTYSTAVTDVPIPLRCSDGFGEAYYGRPEALLDPRARKANSAWSFVGPEVHTRFESELKADLDAGIWDNRYSHLRSQQTFDGSLRLIVGH